MIDVDRTTVDVSGLPAMRLCSGAHVDTHMGSCCAGDPPGYPSYYIQHVYTQRGDTPSIGTTAAIGGIDVSLICDTDGGDAKWRPYWRRLPYEHPRVQLWVGHTYRHYHSCWIDPENWVGWGHKPGDSVVLPNGAWQCAPKTRLPSDYNSEPNKYNPEWVAHIRATQAIEAAEIRAHEARVMAEPRNHCAYQRVVRFYGEHEPRLDYIATPPNTGSQADWWQRYSRRPEPSECPGWNGEPHDSSSRCLLCGYVPKENT